MTATGHAIIGTIIAAKIGNPALAIPIAIASHVAADLFPHWDTGTNKKLKSKSDFFIQSVADLTLSYVAMLLLVVFIFPQTNLIYAFIIVIASQGFDWASAPYSFWGIKNPPIFYWFYRLQKKFDNKLDKPWGIIGQVAVLILLIFIATKF